MYNVIEIRAKRSDAEPGAYGYDAEAVVEDERGNQRFVHVNMFDAFRSYAVRNKSVLGYMAGEDDCLKAVNIEEYDSLDDAKKSQYYDAFAVLDYAVMLLKNGIQ